VKKEMPRPLLTLYDAFCVLPCRAAYVYTLMRLNDQSGSSIGEKSPLHFLPIREWPVSA